MIRVRADDPLSAAVQPLLALHLAEARATTPAEHAHAMDGAALTEAGVAFWTAWRGDALAGFVALKMLLADHGEVKAMRTHPDHLRHGVAAALLAQLFAEARARGVTRLSLETGTAPSYAAANALYLGAGFVDGPVFGGYRPSPHNRFMTRFL